MQPEIITNTEIKSFINDIRKFLKQSEENYETNQDSISMKYLFWGFIIKV